MHSSSPRSLPEKGKPMTEKPHPSEREAWHTAYDALSEVVTQHIAQGDGHAAPPSREEER